VIANEHANVTSLARRSVALNEVFDDPGSAVITTDMDGSITLQDMATVSPADHDFLI
jgi:hypothetical protein